MSEQVRKVIPHDQLPSVDPPLRPIPTQFGTSVQTLTDSTYERLKDDYPLVAETFRKCFPVALATTTQILPDGTTFVGGGDLENMWLRDAAGALEPYVPLCADDERLHRVIVGAIRRMSEYVVLEPYGNSFSKEPTLDDNYWPTDDPPPGPWLRERKWSIDSPASLLRLASVLHGATGELRFADAAFLEAARVILTTFETEQDHAGSSEYRFVRDDPGHPNDTLSHDGRGAPVGRTGMIWSGFRPSDDPCRYGYPIPQNMLASATLSWLSGILRDHYGDAALADKAKHMSDEVRHGIETYGVVEHPRWGRIYASEADGLGNHTLLDDATPPNLVGAPLTGYLSVDDPTYQRTRAFALGPDNPLFINGRHAAGLGSEHPNASPENYVWHIGLITEGQTASTEAEQRRLIELCAATTAGTGFMHEAFDARDPNRYIRGWCAWNDSQFGALVLAWLSRSDS
jgi:meiotically up-regulated gene 157 (Mug157) protein